MLSILLIFRPPKGGHYDEVRSRAGHYDANMTSYLVAGGAGFIGSHLVEELRRRGERGRVVDNLATGKRVNLAHLSGVDFLEATRPTSRSRIAPSRASRSCSMIAFTVLGLYVPTHLLLSRFCRPAR